MTFKLADRKDRVRLISGESPDEILEGELAEGDSEERVGLLLRDARSKVDVTVDSSGGGLQFYHLGYDVGLAVGEHSEQGVGHCD